MYASRLQILLAILAGVFLLGTIGIFIVLIMLIALLPILHSRGIIGAKKLRAGAKAKATVLSVEQAGVDAANQGLEENRLFSSGDNSETAAISGHQSSFDSGRIDPDPRRHCAPRGLCAGLHRRVLVPQGWYASRGLPAHC